MEIKPDNRLIEIASKVSQLQYIIQAYIDDNQEEKDPRIKDFVEELTNTQNYLSDVKGNIGNQIGGLITDQIDNNQTNAAMR